MIQRVQTLWLLIVVMLAALSFKFEFYVGTWINEGIQHQQIVLNGHNPSLMVFIATIVLIIISLMAIFLFKNRKRQLLIVIVDLILSIGLFALYYMEIHRHFLPGSGTLALTSVFVFLLPVFMILAIKGISHDIRLLKRADRLRG